MTIELCDHHKESYTIENFINDVVPQMKEVLTMAARSQGRMDPDFDRAWLSWVSVNSPEYIRFKQAATRSND